jgi:hypothetical protein
MSLQAILNDVEACVRASAAHSAGTPEETAAMALLNDLARLLAARETQQQKSAAKLGDKVFDTAKPLKGKPSAMIELLGDAPMPAPQPVMEVKDLSSQVARSGRATSNMPGDYDPDFPPMPMSPSVQRRVAH